MNFTYSFFIRGCEICVEEEVAEWSSNKTLLAQDFPTALGESSQR